MGGTSTDVSRYAGKLEHVFETTTAEGEPTSARFDRKDTPAETGPPVIIQAPQLDINTVAAGGGSRLFYRHGMFVVGPEVDQLWHIRVNARLTSVSPPPHILVLPVIAKAVLWL